MTNDVQSFFRDLHTNYWNGYTSIHEWMFVLVFALV